MSSKKLVVVFGATGNQGGSVITSILQDPKASAQFTLRGVTRDAAKPSAIALTKRGVEIVSVSINLCRVDGSLFQPSMRHVIGLTSNLPFRLICMIKPHSGSP